MFLFGGCVSELLFDTVTCISQSIIPCSTTWGNLRTPCDSNWVTLRAPILRPQPYINKYVLLMLVGVCVRVCVQTCTQTHTHTYVLCSVKSDLSTGRSVSRLFIADANRQDSGNYTCALGDYVKATVAVHVLAGKYAANTLSRTNTQPPNRHTNTETHARHTPFPIRDLPLMIAQHMWHKCVRAHTHTQTR